MSNTPPILAGRYRISERVYSDANASLHRGYDQLLNRAVGIELLNLNAAPNATDILQDKARRMAQTELPNVAALYDQGEQDGHSYLVIEELAQLSLAEAVPLTPAATADLVTALATTLRAAEQKRVAPPRIDANTVRMTPEGRFQIVNWGSSPRTPTGNLAIVTPLLSLAVTGSEHAAERLKHPQRGARLSPLERIVERAMNGRYATLDELVADVAAAKDTADEPTIVIGRGRPTVIMPVETEPHEQATPPARRPWLPLLLVVLLLLATGALFSRSWFRESGTNRGDGSATAIAEATHAPEPSARPAANQGQPFIVDTVGGQRLNVRSEPRQSASIVGKLNNGDSVRVLEGPVQGGGRGWAHIQAGGLQGWCVYDALRPQ